MEKGMNERNEPNTKYGAVKRFLEAGYGFLICDDIERDVFFHTTNWRSVEIPAVGQKVSFELAPSRVRERAQQAVNVRPIKEDAIEPARIELLAGKGGVQ
jgi:cold shock CspA family protein